MTATTFGGITAEYYSKYRRGYPPNVVSAIVEGLELDDDSTVLDLGCGTGQLTLPLASAVRVAIGMDPEPDMLRLAKRAAGERSVDNVTWLLGADTDIGSLETLLGKESLGGVTIGTAIHFMRPDVLFGQLRRLVRPSGGVAIIANGTPMWLQASPWARALRTHLEAWLGPISATCGTSENERAAYRTALRSAGFANVTRQIIGYEADLDLENVVGQTFSAMSVDQVPTERPRFEGELRDRLRTVEPMERYVEHVDVDILIGRTD